MADWPTESQLAQMEKFAEASRETAEETEDEDGTDRMEERAALMQEKLGK